LTALIVLSALALLIATLLLLPIGIQVGYRDGFCVQARYLFYRRQLYPPLPKKKKRLRKKKKVSGVQEEASAPPPKKKLDYDTVMGYIQIAQEILPTVTKALRRLCWKIRIKKLKLYLRVSGDGPYQTAIRYGQINSGIYGLYAAAGHLFRFRKPSIWVDPDFEGKGWAGQFDAVVKVRPSSLLLFGIQSLWKAFRVFLQQRKKGRQAKAPGPTVG